ncbi:MAG: hypothetical protein IJF52_01840 [Clostridia bacterium]|nr:hypothetical protein [Clostridia bacterium]
MKKYRFTPFVIASMVILGISAILPFLPWLTFNNESSSIMMLTAYNQKVNFELWLSTLLVFMFWLSQALSTPSLVLYFIKKQYAPTILPLLSSLIMLISSITLVISAVLKGTQFTALPFIAATLAIANIVLVILIIKSK